MSKPSPTAFTEVAVSFRHERGHLVCAYVTRIIDTRGGQRAAMHSQHISGVDERLCDLALAEIRRVVLEDVLTAVEPF